MKKTTLLITFSTLLALSSGAQALELLVVSNYSSASSAELWNKAKTDQVPDALLESESIGSPVSSYRGLFPKSFLQDDLFAVCHQDCDQKEIFKLQNGEIREKDKKKWDVVEQSNVYFWLSRYFSFLDDSLQFKPEHFLKVMTNRELRDETKGKIMRNNAFFNPRDISLSFLPATKNLMFKILGGKINRSGFDPSVVVHEASHFLFHHLFPNPINSEIGGLNEGFADYMANIFLQEPKLGLVMLHGKTLRDSSALVTSNGMFKTYSPKMEVHDLGERVSYALWTSREASSDKNLMDRLVIDAVKELGQNPYSTIHDFKEKMLARLSQVIPENKMKNIITTWEMVFPGQSHQIESLNFLDTPRSTKSFLGFKTREGLPKKLADQYGADAMSESNFSILQEVKISKTQSAVLMATEDESSTTPYWIVVDTERSNILGIYDISQNLITDKDELETVQKLAEKATSSNSFTKDFIEKVKSFTELSQGKGEFNSVYKVKNTQVHTQTMLFNGAPVAGQRIELSVKRRFLIGALLGIPEISSITLHTVPGSELEFMPQVSGQNVIGYTLELKTGTLMEVILNKFDK